MKFKSASSNPRVTSSNPWVHIHESVCEAGGSGSEELKNALPLPLQSCDSWMFVKENPDRKKKKTSLTLRITSSNQRVHESFNQWKLE